MNPNCACTGPGNCPRHKMFKAENEFRLCKGLAHGTDCGRKFWIAWERGQLGATAPAEPILEPPSFCVNNGLGDFVANAIGWATGGLVQPCGGCSERRDALNRMFPFAHTNGSKPPYVSLGQRGRDTQSLVSALPVSTSRIIGIARSGLSVANDVAMLMHRPISSVDQHTGVITDLGRGWRLTGHVQDTGPVVVIDDTVMTGNSLKAVLPRIRETYPTALSAAVYVNPNANVKPDIWVRDLPWPHVLEWNLFNSVMTPHCAFDMDGVLCYDCPPGSDDDGANYAKFLAEATPKFYVRKVPITVVTARLMKYERQTRDWFAQNGFNVQELVMGPWHNNQQRAQADVAKFKSDAFKRFSQRGHAIKPPMFVESDPGLAERIAQLSGGIVVCPTSERCY